MYSPLPRLCHIAIIMSVNVLAGDYYYCFLIILHVCVCHQHLYVCLRVCVTSIFIPSSASSCVVWCAAASLLSRMCSQDLVPGSSMYDLKKKMSLPKVVISKNAKSSRFEKKCQKFSFLFRTGTRSSDWCSLLFKYFFQKKGSPVRCGSSAACDGCWTVTWTFTTRRMGCVKVERSTTLRSSGTTLGGKEASS
jgi:hypothetical protein